MVHCTHYAVLLNMSATTIIHVRLLPKFDVLGAIEVEGPCGHLLQLIWRIPVSILSTFKNVLY